MNATGSPPQDTDPPRPALAVRWQQFAAKHDTNCVHCGYSLRGLEHDHCPECGGWIDAANLMYCSEPLEVASLGRSARWFWGVFAANLFLLAISQAYLSPLHSWSPGGSPPAAWYGVATLRILWFTTMAASLSLWRIQLVQESGGIPHEVPIVDRVLRAAHFGALAGTAIHAAWAAVRLLMA